MRGNGIRYGVRFLALGYLGALLIAPLALIFKDTFQGGLSPVWNALSNVDTLHAAIYQQRRGFESVGFSMNTSRSLR